MSGVARQKRALFPAALSRRIGSSLSGVKYLIMALAVPPEFPRWQGEVQSMKGELKRS